MRAYANNIDVTYCTCKDCTKKCWRHVKNFRFNPNENYWYMEICSHELERRSYGNFEE